MGCTQSAADSNEQVAEQTTKAKAGVYDVSCQQLALLPTPQSAVAPRTLLGRENLLSRLPADFGVAKAFLSLETVDLSSNRFTKIPENLSQAPKLTSIDFSANPMARAGAYDALMRLPKLTTLILRDVGMKSVPGALLACKGLVTLDLSCNPALLLGGKGAPAMERMTQLRTLRITDCDLQGELPSGIRTARLTSLDISRNSRLDLSDPKAWAGLRKTLQHLVLDDMALFALPRGVTSCVGLKRLSMRENRLLESLSGVIFLTEMVELDLTNCELVHLPADVDTAERITELRLGGNLVSASPQATAAVWGGAYKRALHPVSGLSHLTVIDISPLKNHPVDTAAIACLASCKTLTAVTLGAPNSASAKTAPVALLTSLPRLASLNGQPVPEDASSRVRSLLASSNAPLTVTVSALPDPEEASEGFVQWVSAINDARNALTLHWSTAVLRYRAFRSGLSVMARQPSTDLSSSTRLRFNDTFAPGDHPPLDVAAVHLAFALLGLADGDATVPPAPYFAERKATQLAACDTWHTVLRMSDIQLTHAAAEYDLLGSTNPLDVNTITEAADDDGNVPYEDPKAALDALLGFTSHMAAALSKGPEQANCVRDYLRLLALPCDESRYLSSMSQLTAMMHFVVNPELFALDVGSFCLAADTADTSAVLGRFASKGALFDYSDAALGRTLVAWDKTYSTRCPAAVMAPNATTTWSLLH
jgi:Leucine-rich repeat (LRR) protein